MKILELLSEGKFSKSEYAYHATKGEHLRSILKQGLIPNKSENGYGSGEISLGAGYSLSPLAGVYFSRKPYDVEAICKGYGGAALIIICMIQPQDIEMDEDRLTDDVIEEEYLYKNINRHIRNFLEKESNNYDLADFTEEHVNKYAEEYTNNIIKEKLFDLDSRLLTNIKPDLKNYIIAIVDFVIATESGLEVDDSSIKMYQEKLTQKLRSLAKDKKQNTFKINKIIGFKGSNKIIGIYNRETGEGWGDLGAFERSIYNKVSNPLKLIATSH